MTPGPQAVHQPAAHAGFSAVLKAGDVLHLWQRPANPTQTSHILLNGPNGVKLTLAGPPSDDFQMTRFEVDRDGQFDFEWNEKDSLVSVCYAFQPDAVLDAGIRLLFAAPRTIADHKRYRLHFSPPFGWMNDPNGLIEIDGRTHFFYQHYPHYPRWNTMHWGHAASRDLVDWVDLPVFVHPRADMLASNAKTGGAFSGSAIQHGKGGLRIFHTEREDGRAPEQEWQLTATSSDLISVSAPSVVIDRRPPLQGFGKDLRDPFVFKGPDGLWKMVLGGADESAALVLLYETRDPDAAGGWTFSGILHREPLARAVPAECPCVLALDGEGEGLFALIFGLIGHQTPINGRLNPSYALTGRFDGKRFVEVARRELDFIGDFYAFQGFSYHGRPVGFAWAANWASFGRGHDFLSSATFARRLVWQHGMLKMPVVETVHHLRSAPLATTADALLQGVSLPEGLAEIRLQLSGANAFQLTFVHADGPLVLSYENGRLELLAPQSRPRIRQAVHGIKTAPPQEVVAYVDVGVIEIFIDGGRLCGTRRVDSDAPITSVKLAAAQDCVSDVHVWRLRPRAGR